MLNEVKIIVPLGLGTNITLTLAVALNEHLSLNETIVTE